MKIARGVTRRGALSLIGGACAYSLAPIRFSRAATRQHGLTVIGDLKYPPGFRHFDYVNPSAPKGGRIVTQITARAYNQDFNTFNTLNMYVLQGVGAKGMDLTFASLMTRSEDEPGSVYGFAVAEVEIGDDGRLVRFFLRPEATFHDGSPLTAADVVFSIETLKSKGHPLIATDLRHVEEITAEDDHTVRLRLSENAGLSLPVTVATTPIFSKAWWEGRDFHGALSTPPLGSGLYKVEGLQLRQLHRIRARGRPVGRDAAGDDRAAQFRDHPLRLLPRPRAGVRSLQEGRDHVPRGVHLAGLGDATTTFPR